ncbi:hypothetical protein [Allorhodopirellula heiligendammensis]|uniref:Uncharacterized protein n=1 Tax=Allorhodopirellula heiligendammensis TaxID=2714739 RepID=A0A5C6C8T5_9BACT|nr:hypothetical protein [Allorhodopirellula heiligendammensis]TWU19179.1 hypothetical protein Poly21_13500 [Allorhodopirellula heiligendammensis]
MKLISLTCNHCGAPLDVPKSAKFVTCAYCNARLSIHHTGSTYSTELLDEIKQTTDTLVRDVEKLKGNSELDRLDRQWDRDRSQFMSTHENGTQSVPSKGPILFGTGCVAMFGVFWTILAGSMFPPMALFGIVFILFAVGSGIYGSKKADQYEQAKRSYHQQRRKLIAEQNQAEAD